MANSGFENPDILQNILAKAIIVDTGIIPQPDGNYEMTDTSDSHAIFKTFSRDIHNGVYIKFDPAQVEINL